VSFKDLALSKSYIPDKYAVVGEYVKIRGADGVWTNGWLVLSSGVMAEDPPDWRKSIRGHRETTGDSLPKC
jgi:hypothetical protein